MNYELVIAGIILWASATALLAAIIMDDSFLQGVKFSIMLQLLLLGVCCFSLVILWSIHTVFSA